ncbi:cobalamin biosynthesis protein CobG [Palleronia sp. THAF1]|uniref:cobalamin biosynthesis protein CobG n=1 Tax=Palleronia sp. THAF1 TaxID=2587842 RepID=UPI000F536D1C|nr:cobalamin biosynthesis protein CobG [Palleronia sp. THAF1]
MRSGDGLVVRVRPRLARLSREQAVGLADLAGLHGSGIVELTRRGNVQLRGVSEATLTPLQKGLALLGLLDTDPGTETKRNILTTPFSAAEDMSERIGTTIEARLGELPELPAKFGFIVDCGETPVLAGDPGDIRIERAPGGVVVRPDGGSGTVTAENAAPDAVIALAHWFARHRTPDQRRMRDIAAGEAAPIIPAGERPTPGQSRFGPMVGVAFGQMDATLFAAAARALDSLRITPWRMLILEGATAIPDGFITAPDPILSVDACPGAPFCAEATVETRDIARLIAGRADSIHVSGCAKGCARSASSAVTLVGRDGRFDLVKEGCAGDTPCATGIAPEDVPDAL